MACIAMGMEDDDIPADEGAVRFHPFFDNLPGYGITITSNIHYWRSNYESTTKGQVTVPQHIREKLGIIPATEIDFVEEEGNVFLVKRKAAPSLSRGQQALGCLTFIVAEGLCKGCRWQEVFFIVEDLQNGPALATFGMDNSIRQNDASEYGVRGTRGAMLGIVRRDRRNSHR